MYNYGFETAKAQSGGSTPQTLTTGVVPGSPTYTIYADSLTYYAKDAYGAVSS
jgi:hypothetical protein